MEAAAAVALIAENKNFKANNVRCEVLGVDGDASAVANVQAAVDHEVKKNKDFNHTLKSFSGKLYKAKEDGFKFLSKNVITYLKACFKAGVKQNVNDAQGLQADFKNIVHHTFGEHDRCRDWCKAKGNPKYVHKFLPKKQKFSDILWRRRLEAIIDGFVAQAESIAPNASTQINESLNHMCVTRAPRARFYGGSPALGYRVASAVLQKNEGSNHIIDVYHQAGLSPGKKTKASRETMDKNCKRRAEHQRTEGAKKRRLFNKFQTSSNDSKNNKGVSYMSGMGDLMESAATGGISTQSSDPTGQDWIPRRQKISANCTTVIVDIETTDLSARRQII